MSRPLGRSIDTWTEWAPHLREWINWKFLVDVVHISWHGWLQLYLGRAQWLNNV